ncbi:Inositol phosphoceramide mannosyltransferase 3 [Porphyridium purpureum]|uniref:Inositol phosphoceramide mannosyltransferase 3 n=1 Tax=Porphyridium purpureum TaxID=35688 RepID=A0A5J4YXX9_PORPP|nr:Inositol phosphoceramide mannosyltransferase 3 [Porphyridium purpureum]|eukprot:POR3663..scf209_3
MGDRFGVAMAAGLTVPASYLDVGIKLPDDVHVADIGKFGNWDGRECRVENAHEWKDAIREYLAHSPLARQDIPKVIHQIWIGPREAPCVWLDSWRIEYLGRFSGWKYELWSDSEVHSMDMVNRDLYDKEQKYQCKADILRLELLYKYGGVYIDADMVSLGKDLSEVMVDANNSTKFMISYEPDTKDKPYSVIGNSIIAVTPGHPLILMLILYIRKIYDHKRPYHGVEWVTGPLAATKVLVHQNMPFSCRPTNEFYPLFHFVPNPDAIDLSKFPRSYAFQFGYTCSGLENWIAQNNRCRKAVECSIHSKKTDWEFGRFKPFPTSERKSRRDGESQLVPKVIHQIYLEPDARSCNKPERWTMTWYGKFCSQHPEYEYRMHCIDDLVNSEYFCVNLYSTSKRMDATAVTLLAMEIVYKYGGVYVPLGCTFESGGDAVAQHSMGFKIDAPFIFSPAEDTECASRIKQIYNGLSPDVPSLATVVTPQQDGRGVAMRGVGDSVAAYMDYPLWSRFLGTEMIINAAFPSSALCDEVMLLWGYDSNVQTYKLESASAVAELLSEHPARCVIVTDEELCRYRAFRDCIPSMIIDLDKKDPDWSAMLLSVEWETGLHVTECYRPSMSVRASAARYFGLVLNQKAANRLFGSDELRKLTMSEQLIDLALQRYEDCGVYVAVQKFEHTKVLADMYAGIHTIQYAFEKLANHSPPTEISGHPVEQYGSMLKVFRDSNRNNIMLEMSADDSGRVMYRAWNEDNAVNCEAKILRGMRTDIVEWMRVYYNHQVVFEANNKPI